MEALKVLVTSASGLLSIAAFVAMVGMAGYLLVHLRKLMNARPGKEGWN
jgi:hypothetical protein